MNFNSIKKKLHYKIKSKIDEYLDMGIPKISYLRRYFRSNKAISDLIKDIQYEAIDQFENKEKYRSLVYTIVKDILNDYEAYYKDKKSNEDKIIKNFDNFLNEKYKNLSDRNFYSLNSYRKGVELVPIDQIEKFKEFDREKDKKWGKNDESLKELKEKIIKEGLKNPIKLEISLEDGGYYGLITEGNTRLSVVKKLGLEYIPVRVVNRDRKWKGTVYEDKVKKIDIPNKELNRKKVKERYGEPMFETPINYGFDSILPEDLL